MVTEILCHCEREKEGKRKDTTIHDVEDRR